MTLQRRFDRLQDYLRQIDNYDRTVKEIIDGDEQIKKAWNAFYTIYSLRVNDELCRTAEDKISREDTAEIDGNVCSECHLPKHRFKERFYNI